MMLITKIPQSVYFIGIKGSGCAALAELLTKMGLSVTGSDVDEVFYTDSLLNALKIPFFRGFNAKQLQTNADLVVYSAAYSAKNVEFAAAQALNLPMLSYPQALAFFSSRLFKKTVAIAGVHGKTTTTALSGSFIESLHLPFSALAGSAITHFQNQATCVQGNEAFFLESCEYRRHFLNLAPFALLLIAVEMDHQDYFKDLNDLTSAFVELALKLPAGGIFVYCADDVGAVNVATIVKQQRQDLTFVDYGFKAQSMFKLQKIEAADEKLSFSIAAFAGETLSLNRPGNHLALNACGLIALLSSLGATLSPASINQALKSYEGAKRRSEVLKITANNILIMDDYAHHPTAIKTTLAGLKAFYPKRRLVVSFMSHTYSRTEALFDDFAQSFAAADIVIFHKIFASAREAAGHISGYQLFEQSQKYHQHCLYFEEPLEALPWLKENLKANDLFITLGAGSSFVLSETLAKILE